MRNAFFGFVVLVLVHTAFAAAPPSLINYQGTLHDSNDQPLSGTYDMVFRFYDAATGGVLMLTDSHTGGGGVTVTGGLFDAALGSGAITPGSESTLADTFANHGAVYLELQVGVETLTPRVQLLSSAFSLNAGTLNGLKTGSASGNIPVNNGALNSDLNAGMLNGLTAGNATGNVAVNNGTLNANLNADLLDGLNAGNGSGNIAVSNGGLNTDLNADLLDGLHSTSFAASVHTHAATDITSGTLSAARGGTGSDTSGAVAGSILRAAGGGVWAAMAPGSEGQVMTISSGTPAWATNSGITGGGTANFLPKFLGSNSIGNSVIAESGGKIGIGTSAPGTLLEVEGTGLFNGASSFSFLANGADGVVGKGTEAGGLFADLDNIGYAWVGYGNRGIEAYGQEVGGYFKDFDNSGNAYLGYADFGIYAGGNSAGGYFYDSDNLGSQAYVAAGIYGIWGHGTVAGGLFTNPGSGYALLGNGDNGVEGYGNNAGGYFKDADNSGYVYAGTGDTGISAGGNSMGGYFQDLTEGTYVRLAYANYPIYASVYGGASYFENTYPNGSVVYLASGWGINVYGSSQNGTASAGPSQFYDTSSGAYTWVGWDTEKIFGSGSVDFVQNHPVDKNKVIAYAAPEGDEVATYTRGTARLENGVAHVKLGDTFQWVTNPDIGLTANVTPKGAWADLYVESISTKELVVKSKDPAASALFDYVVYGLRIGFEEVAIVRDKMQESWIPSMLSQRLAYEKDPELRQYNALERFKGMRAAAGETSVLDLSASQALHDAIHEFDPAVDKIDVPKPSIPPEDAPRTAPALQPPAPAMAAPAEPNRKMSAPPERPQPVQSVLPMDADGNVYAKSFRPQSGDFAKSMQVSQAVEAGDVLVVDRNNPDWLRPADTAADAAVVGVVAAEPGVILGESKETSHKNQPANAPVAISGIVQCKVDAGYGAIQIGDLLTTSATPGYAMRAQNPAPGTVIGKALQPLDTGTGVIRIIIMHE